MAPEELQQQCLLSSAYEAAEEVVCGGDQRGGPAV